VEATRAASENSRIGTENLAHAGLAACRARIAAIRAMEDVVMPSVEDNDSLARRSFEVGEMRLADLFLVRREGLEARVAYLDALLAAALSEVDILTRAGGLQ
jgi:cobalt-zinc-cadmium efflux system outer membrane protein